MNPIQIDYKQNLEKDVIEKAVFQIEDEKFLELSVVDIFDLDVTDKIIRQDLRILLRDLNYGEEEMFVELNAENGKDFNKIMTKIIRQINGFKPTT